MLGRGRQRCSLGQYSCQRGWAGFAFLKKKDGKRQSPDIPVLFDHSHQWLALSSWTVSQPRALVWDCPACAAAGMLPTRLWLVLTHLLPGSAKPFSQDSWGQGLFLLGSRDKGALFGERREYLCVDMRCGSHLLLKQRKGSGPCAGTTFGCPAAGEGWSILKMYRSLIARGSSLPWAPGSSTRGPFWPGSVIFLSAFCLLLNADWGNVFWQPDKDYIKQEKNEGDVSAQKEVQPFSHRDNFLTLRETVFAIFTGH